MRVLIVAEHDGTSLRRASLSCFSFARSVAAASDGEVTWLVLGADLNRVTDEAARFGPVLVAESPALARPMAEPFARVISAVVRERDFHLVCAASSTFAKDIVPRAAAQFGGAMASDVMRHDWVDGRLQLDCPQFAGAVTATLRLLGAPQFVTVRAASYPAATREAATPFSIEPMQLDAALLACRGTYEGSKSKKNARPDVTDAKVVVSGGRAFKDSDDFERLVGGLADVLGGATGSSRALVDAGITPNELQVGQTGKIVAPELYVALGISGAVQHLAGMKNSRTIVAINSDPDAPIFDVADIGLVGDVYSIVPELIEKLHGIGARSAEKGIQL
jgi:electron transfer flavoprotein alpha subunit